MKRKVSDLELDLAFAAAMGSPQKVLLEVAARLLQSYIDNEVMRYRSKVVAEAQSREAAFQVALYQTRRDSLI